MATYFTTIPKENGQNIRFYSADRCDRNGHRRIIVHYIDFLNLSDYAMSYLDYIKADHMTEWEYRFQLASKRAKKAGFKKFDTKEFAGGFICQYDFCHCKDIALRIENAIKAVPFESAL